MLCPLLLQAQLRPNPTDTLSITDSLLGLSPNDTLPEADSLLGLSPNDTLPEADSLLRLSPNDTLLQQLRISPDSLSTRVTYTAFDSIFTDLPERKTYLFGQARVQYEEMTLEADYIMLDWNKQELYARGLPDSTGQISGKPHFSDGSQDFQASEMRYNFNTRKGIIIDARTTYEDLYLQTRKAKFFSEVDTSGSSLLYGQSAIFTTCNAEHPHYGIRSTKQKIITEKIAIVGPSNLEILDVPTPLWLPFGFFPLKKGRSTGLIFPRDFNFDQRYGFGLNNVGWYFPLNDYLGLQLTGDLYFKGSFRLRTIGNYAKRYKYKGNFRLEYANLVQENALAQTGRKQTFEIYLSHQQDSRAHPSRNIGGNIHIQTGNALKLNYNDPYSQLTNTLSSNFSWRESFPDKPYSMSLTFSHSQNTQTQEVKINFPTFNFQATNLRPFKRSQAVGKRKWYEDITLSYASEAKASLNTIDSLLFEKETLNDLQYGAKHNVNISSSFKILKYLNFNPRATYNEFWYFDQLHKTFDPDTVFVFDYEIDKETGDTLSVTPKDTLYGTVITDTLRDFRAVRQFNLSASLSTKLFGTMLFKRGPLRGLRHVMTPSVSLSYRPDYTGPNWGYFDYVQVDSRNPDSLVIYNKFANGIYGSAPQTGGGLSLNYKLDNVFEAKLFSKRDSSTRNIFLLKRFTISGSYQLGKPELPFSQVTANGNTSLFKGLGRMEFRFTFDPYEEEDGQRINTFVWDNRRKPLRFVKGEVRFATSGINFKKLQTTFFPNSQNEQQSELAAFFSQLALNYNLVWNIRPDTTFISIHSLNLQGSIPLSQLWKLQITSIGYDFAKEKITYPSFSISRDLHCWEMGLSWYPANDSYTFYLRVDTGSPLDFIKIPYQKGIAQGGFSGFQSR